MGFEGTQVGKLIVEFKVERWNLKHGTQHYFEEISVCGVLSTNAEYGDRTSWWKPGHLKHRILRRRTQLERARHGRVAGPTVQAVSLPLCGIFPYLGGEVVPSPPWEPRPRSTDLLPLVPYSCPFGTVTYIFVTQLVKRPWTYDHHSEQTYFIFSTALQHISILRSQLLGVYFNDSRLSSVNSFRFPAPGHQNSRDRYFHLKTANFLRRNVTRQSLTVSHYFTRGSGRSLEVGEALIMVVIYIVCQTAKLDTILASDCIITFAGICPPGRPGHYI